MRNLAQKRASRLAAARTAFPSETECRDLIHRAWALRFSDPAESVWHARLAVPLADRLRHVGLQAQSRAILGNAYRILGRLDRAERWLSAAASLDPSGPVAAQVLAITASLKRMQGNPEAAVKLLEEALPLSEPTRVVDLLVQLAIAWGDISPVRALEYLTKAARIVDTNDLRAQVLIHHNAAEILLDNGQLDEAWRTVSLLRALYEVEAELGDNPGRWHLEAKLRRAHRLGGEPEFRLAVVGYRAQGRELGEAVATLELAALFAEVGRQSEASDLLGDALPLFERLRVGEVSLSGVAQALSALRRRSVAT